MICTLSISTLANAFERFIIRPKSFSYNVSLGISRKAFVVGEAGIEPATPSLEGSCSIQLSYSPACFDCMRAGCASIHGNTEKTPSTPKQSDTWMGFVGYDFRAAMASSRAVFRVLTQSPTGRNSMQITRLYFSSASLR